MSSIEDLRRLNAQLGVSVDAIEDVSILARPVEFAGLTIPNSLAVHPMEGCDGDAQGRPDDLTVRRYERFAAGGAGLIWAEAIAVVEEARANPRQLWLHRGQQGGLPSHGPTGTRQGGPSQWVRTQAGDRRTTDPFRPIQQARPGAQADDPAAGPLPRPDGPAAQARHEPQEPDPGRLSDRHGRIPRPAPGRLRRGRTHRVRGGFRRGGHQVVPRLSHQ